MSSSPAKILYVIGSLEVGGAERHLLQILPRLLDLSFNVTVFTLTHKGKLAPSLEVSGVRVIEPFFSNHIGYLPLFLRKPLRLFSAFFSFAYLLFRWQPSIVHCFLPAAYLFAGISSLLFGKHIRLMSRRSLNHYQRKRPILAKVERWLHRHMNAVLGNSAAVADELRKEGVAETRLGLLYNGIDLTPFDNLPPRLDIRQSLGFRKDTLLMVCVANLIPYKGHADLIKALGSIADSLPLDWAILMVGRDTGIGEELRRLAEHLGVGKHIFWLGERSDVATIYSSANIGILCSHEEGFSNSVLEGMAANVAMVTTDVGGNSEAVNYGECGIIVPPRAPQALGEAILALSKDDEMRLRMAAAGRRRVKLSFSVESCVSRYASLYRSLLVDPDCHAQRAIDVGPIYLKE